MRAPEDADIVLVVPVGTQRSARVALPLPAAKWLLAQLHEALGDQPPQPKWARSRRAFRACRALHRKP